MRVSKQSYSVQQKYVHANGWELLIVLLCACRCVRVLVHFRMCMLSHLQKSIALNIAPSNVNL